MQHLASFVGGRWLEGRGAGQLLLNPATEEPPALAPSEGVDLPAALEYARNSGGSALRAPALYLQRVALQGSRPQVQGLAKGESTG